MHCDVLVGIAAPRGVPPGGGRLTQRVTVGRLRFVSERRVYNIRCPRCGQELTVELYESINVQTDPHLRDELMANRLNTVRCDGCELTFRVDKTLLYHDPKRRIMIYLMPEAENDSSGALTETLAHLGSLLPSDVQAPRLSVVGSRVELVERIFLFESGLDERIIEYLKYLLYTRNPTKLDPRTKNVLFDAEDSDANTLCFVVQDIASRQLEAMLRYDRKVYTALTEVFDRDEDTPKLLELFPGPRISARLLVLKELEKERSSTPPAEGD